MKKETFGKLLQGALFLFDGDTDGDLLLRKGYTYNEIQNCRKILEFVVNFEGEKKGVKHSENDTRTM